MGEICSTYGERDKYKQHFGKIICRSETTRILRHKNVKSLNLINQAPSHEDIWWRRDIAPLFLSSTLGGGQWTVRAPAALPPGNEPPVGIGQEAEWAPVPVWKL
jgi:hypothetical protein